MLTQQDFDEVDRIAHNVRRQELRRREARDFHPLQADLPPLQCGDRFIFDRGDRMVYFTISTWSSHQAIVTIEPVDAGDSRRRVTIVVSRDSGMRIQRSDYVATLSEWTMVADVIQDPQVAALISQVMEG